MRCYLVLLMAILVGASNMTTAAEEPAPGKQVAAQRTLKIDDQEITVRYWLFLPAELASKEKWPLMLFLHGAGERGDDLELVKKWGPPSFVEKKSDFPFILISPQCPEDEHWEAATLVQLVNKLSGELPIDKQRMYVTGLSMGGYGTWRLLAEHPTLFAAAVPICGGGDDEKAANLVEIPIWAFHGDQDEAVPLEQSQKMIEAIKAAGGQKAKLTVYEGVGHNSWSQTYDNPEVYDWLLSHKRSD